MGGGQVAARRRELRPVALDGVLDPGDERRVMLEAQVGARAEGQQLLAPHADATPLKRVVFACLKEQASPACFAVQHLDGGEKLRSLHDSTIVFLVSATPLIHVSRVGGPGSWIRRGSVSTRRLADESGDDG